MIKSVLKLVAINVIILLSCAFTAGLIFVARVLGAI